MIKVFIYVAMGVVAAGMVLATVWFLLSRRKAGGEQAGKPAPKLRDKKTLEKLSRRQAGFQEKWQDLQQLCRDKLSWGEAVTKADDLLGEALKKRRFRGKGIGERLVKAQKMLTDNDSAWFGHKLRNKIDTEPNIKLREQDVKQALIGIRQALKDLGALPNGQPGNKR
jgi:hypothetical protein